MGLTLGRRVGETIQIGPDIFVTPVRIRDGSVRLDIVAPQKFEILRTELDKYASDRKKDRPVNSTKDCTAEKSFTDHLLRLHEQQNQSDCGTTG